MEEVYFDNPKQSTSNFIQENQEDGTGNKISGSNFPQYRKH